MKKHKDITWFWSIYGFVHLPPLRKGRTVASVLNFWFTRSETYGTIFFVIFKIIKLKNKMFFISFQWRRWRGGGRWWRNQRKWWRNQRRWNRRQGRRRRRRKERWQCGRRDNTNRRVKIRNAFIHSFIHFYNFILVWNILVGI